MYTKDRTVRGGALNYPSTALRAGVPLASFNLHALPGEWNAIPCHTPAITYARWMETALGGHAMIGPPSCEVELHKLAQIVILYNFGSMCEQPVCAIST